MEHGVTRQKNSRKERRLGDFSVILRFVRSQTPKFVRFDVEDGLKNNMLHMINSNDIF